MARYPTSGDSRRVTLLANELRGMRPAGGMGSATAFLAIALARMGHATEILIGRDPARAIDPYWEDVYRSAGVRIRRAADWPERVEPAHFRVTRNIELALRDDPPDVVVAPDFGAPGYAAVRMRQAGLGFENTLFVVSCHGPRRYVLDVSPAAAPSDLRSLLAVSVLERLSVEAADVVVSPSRYLVEWMRGQRWRLPEQTVVIPHLARSTATGEAVPTSPEREAIVRLRRLTFFGRLDEKKGLEIFARGLSALEPDLLEGLELEFLGRPTSSWPIERIEGLLGEPARRSLRGVSFETELDQHEALARLRRRGTLAVMPSLGETFSYTVCECLEHRIPFIASNVGGVPELIAPEDHTRVLFEPTPSGVEGALRRMLAAETLRPARPAFHLGASIDAWADVIGSPPRRQAYVDEEAVDVVVAHGDRSPVAEAAATGTAPFVLLLDDQDVPDDELVPTLLRAQRATRADVVTCGFRVVDGSGGRTLHFFSGEPGGLGALANDYGETALVRRSLLRDVDLPWEPEADPAWPLLAALAGAGARIVSVPVPLVTRMTAPLAIERNQSDALLVVEQLESRLPDAVRSLARLVAGVAADAGGRPPAAASGAAGRAADILRDGGVSELVRRALRRSFRRPAT